MIPETEYSEHLPPVVLSTDNVVAEENHRQPENPNQLLAELQSLDEHQETARTIGLVDLDDILNDLMEGMDDDLLNDSLAWTQTGAEFDMFSYVDPDFKGHHTLDRLNNIVEEATGIGQDHRNISDCRENGHTSMEKEESDASREEEKANNTNIRTMQHRQMYKRRSKIDNRLNKPEKSLQFDGQCSAGEAKHKCRLCNKSRKEHMQNHERKHTSTAPRCDICNKSFGNKSHLSVHLLIHTGEKPHSCVTCGKSFRRKAHLTDHLTMHSDELPFKCETCNKKFRLKSNLSRHMRIHTGVKPHFCGLCGKSFYQKVNLQTHLMVHSDNKPCKICKKKFQPQSSFECHMESHRNRRELDSS